jgi:hypothetical protein
VYHYLWAAAIRGRFITGTKIGAGDEGESDYDSDDSLMLEMRGPSHPPALAPGGVTDGLQMLPGWRPPLPP